MIKLLKIFKIINNIKGYTILETVISLSIITIIVSSLSSIIIYTCNVNKKIFVKHELFENARITMDFITKQINLSHGIELQCSNGCVLNKLLLYKDYGVYEKNITVFEYLSAKKIFRFGGRDDKSLKYTTQELSKYISNIEVKVYKNRKLMLITVTTDKSINGVNIKLDEPIVLTNVIDIKNKNIK